MACGSSLSLCTTTASGNVFVRSSFVALVLSFVSNGFWSFAFDKNSAMADAFGANRTPECFLFDKEGRLVYHGAIDDNAGDASAVSRKHLIEAMTEITSNKDVTVKKSRSVGCTIKRQ